MYRYTVAKNKQANLKLKQKQQRQRQKTQTVGRKVTRQQGDVSTKRTVKPVKQKKKHTKQPFAWWVGTGVMIAYAMGGAILCALLYAIWWLAVNTILPEFFYLDGERNYLVLDRPLGEMAEWVYLVHVNPETEMVTVKKWSGQALVSAGEKGYYPIGTLGGLTYFLTGDWQEVKQAYNLVLRRPIEEVFFVEMDEELADLSDVRRLVGQLWNQRWQATSSWDEELTDLYFQLRQVESFAVQTHDSVNKEALTPRVEWDACPVVIVNAAGANGLGRQWGEVMKANGVRLVDPQTATEIVSTSEIYYDQGEEECLAVVEMVSRMFPAMKTVVADNGRMASGSRAKAMIILGQDIAE